MGATVRIAILANANQAVAGIRSTHRELGILGRTSSRLGTALKTGIFAGVAVGLGAAGKSAAGFEQELSNIKAVTGATATEMSNLSAKALEIGKKTAFSASEGAQAIEELAKAGVSTKDILAGAADATVALAAAGSVDLPQAAGIAANALNAFGLNAKKMGKVSDVIAGAANASAIDVGQFGDSLAQVGASAKLAGLSFADTAVAIAEMGNAGIKGADAGTSLKSFLSRLTPTAKPAIKAMKELGLITEKGGNQFFTAGGKLKPLSKIQEILKKSTQDLTKEQKLQALGTIFGSDAIRAAATLAENGAKGYDKLSTAIGKVNASDVAKEKLNNFKGALENLKGSLETVAIQIGIKFLPALKKLAEDANKLVGKLGDNLPAIFDTLGAAVDHARGPFNAFVAVLKNPVFQSATAGVLAFVAAYKTIQAIQGAVAAIKAARAAVLLFNAALLANPIGLTVIVVATLAAALIVLWKRSQTAREIMSTAFAGIGLLVLTNAQFMLKGFRIMTDGALSAAGIILKALAAIPGPTQENAKKALKAFEGFKTGVDGVFDKIDGTLSKYKADVLALPKRIKLEGDETDLKAKIAQGLADLKKLPKDKQTKVKAEITDAIRKLDFVRAKLLGIKDRYVTVFVSEQNRDRATAGRQGGTFGTSAFGRRPLSAELLELKAGGSAFLTTLEAAVGPIVQAGADLADQLGRAVTKYAEDSKAADTKVSDARKALTGVQTKYRQTMSDTARAETRAAAETKKARDAVSDAKAGKGRAAAVEALKKAHQRENDLIRNNNRKQLKAKKDLDAALGKVDAATAAKARLRLSNGILVNPAEAKKLQAYIKSQTAQLQKFADLQDETTKALDEATARLADAVKARDDFAESVAESVGKSGSILSLDKAEDGTTTTTSIIDQFRARAQAAADFAKNILGLQTKGLNQSLITELATAGVDSSGQTVTALLTATPADLSAINASQAAIVASGEALGKALAATYFDSGVKNAQALVDGLKSKQAEIEATMRALAKAANTAYADALATGRIPTAVAALATAPSTFRAGVNSTITIKGNPGPEARQVIQVLKDHVKTNGPITGVVFAG